MKQDTTPTGEASNQASLVQTLHPKLSKLWKICGMKSEWPLLSSRAEEVLHAVAESGWEQYRPVCEAELAAARRLWSNSEELLVEVAERNSDVDQSLLRECQELLTACDRWVSSEEEILELNDLSAETYVSAHGQRDLVWQKYFCDKSP